MSSGVLFVSGLLTTGYAIAALFFLRFWRDTHDRLFGLFATAFSILSLQRILITFTRLGDVVYVIRLAAFLLIIVAIVEKNRNSHA